MRLYEHTVIIKHDITKKELEKITEKYEGIISKNLGKIIKFENWGLMVLSHKIKKSKKGHYLHFKLEGDGNVINELEKNEKIDNQVLRFLTVKVKKFDLNVQYFGEKKGTDNQVKA